MEKVSPISIVGAGPGAIDLLTIRALDRIKNYLSKFSLAAAPEPSSNEWQDWETLLGSTYCQNNEPLTAMCIKTDIGFQTVSSCLIAIPGFQPRLGKKKPIFKYANGSPDLNSFKELKI